MTLYEQLFRHKKRDFLSATPGHMCDRGFCSLLWPVNAPCMCYTVCKLCTPAHFFFFKADWNSDTRPKLCDPLNSWDGSLRLDAGSGSRGGAIDSSGREKKPLELDVDREAQKFVSCMLPMLDQWVGEQAEDAATEAAETSHHFSKKKNKKNHKEKQKKSQNEE